MKKYILVVPMIIASLFVWQQCGRAVSTPTVESSPEEAAAKQQASIAAEIFRAWGEKVAAAQAAGNMTVSGEDGWMFMDAELRHMSVGEFWGEDAAKVSRSKKPENADPMPAILDFNAQLAQLGVELILLPVPPKAVVYPEKIGGQLPRIDVHHQEFYQELRENGVQVVDLTDDFIATRDQGEPLFCKQDTHWSGTGIDIAAAKLSEIIKAKSWYEGLPKQTFSSEERSVEITGDLWNSLADDSIEKESVGLRFVSSTAGEILQDDRNSPILVLGDSHTRVFQSDMDLHAIGAGLINQLALQLGTTIDLLGVKGSGATPARISLFQRSRSNAEYVKNKKIIIWCFTAREFTEADGWRKVPVVRKVNN